MSYIRQQENPYAGLFSLIGGIMGENARKRGEIKNYQAQTDYANSLDNLDYGGQTNFQDLGSQANPNSSYLNKANVLKTQQSLLPNGTDFLKSPTSDTIGQGLLSQWQQKPSVQPIVTQQQASNFEFANPMAKYSKENNPVSITQSAPKTLQDQTKMIKAQQASAMKELIAKGYSPKEIIPLLQQVTNEKIAEHTANFNQNQINELYQGFVSEENPNKKAMYAARLKNLGYDVTTPYKEFAPTYQSEKINTGGQQLGLSFNPKTGKYEQQFTVNNTVTPDAQLNADTRIKTTQMNNDNAIQIKSMGGYGRGGSGGASNGVYNGGNRQKISGMTQSQIDNEVSRYKQWKFKNPDSSIDEYPRQAQYERASDPYGHYEEAGNIIDSIKQSHPDATDEDIFLFLNDRLQGR